MFLQPAASCVSMVDHSALGVEQKGLATPTVLGIDHPLVLPLLKKFVDVFCDPVFPPDTYIIHDLVFFYPTS